MLGRQEGYNKMRRNIELLKLLSDESRLEILNILLREDSYVEKIACELSLTPATVCYHLKKLEDAGVVNSSRSQFYIIYSTNREIFEKPLYELIQRDESDSDREEKYKKSVISSFFKYGRLTKIPSQQKKREIVLAEIANEFDIDRTYSEKEVNEIILRYHDDFCTIRREMIAFKMMSRDRESYRRIK